MKENKENKEMQQKSAKLPVVSAEDKVIDYLLETGLESPVFLFEGRYYRRKRDLNSATRRGLRAF